MEDSFYSDIARWIDENKERVTGVLKELVSIKSVGEDPVTTAEGEVYPFGQGVQDAFAYMLDLAEKDGFAVKDVDHYGGHIDYVPAAAEAPEDGEQSREGGRPDRRRKTVGVIGHVDVVPEGEGWEHGPYSAYEEDGEIWGRGTTDDKGPLLASYFALKALIDTGHLPESKVRIIIGLDEETEWKGVDHYFRKERCPELGISPDAFFPVVNGEKGILDFRIAGKLNRTALKGLTLRKLTGGTAVNMVPDSAAAVLNDPSPAKYDKIREMAEAYGMKTGHPLRIRKVGKSIEVRAEGKAAHGSMPEQGLNAVSILIGFLGELDFVNDGLSDFFDFYNDAIGLETDGSGLGIAMSDEKSGGLTLNVGMVAYDGKAISVECDVRYPVTKTSDEVYRLMTPKLDEYGLGVLKEGDRPPFYFDRYSFLVKTCIDCYREVSGDEKTEPLVMGGGTYARACNGFVAFGGLYPGDPDLMHQKNERIGISRYFDMIRIYAGTIYRLSLGEKPAEEEEKD